MLAGTLLLARLREAALESVILVLVGATIALVAAVSLWKQVAGQPSGGGPFQTCGDGRAGRSHWIRGGLFQRG